MDLRYADWIDKPVLDERAEIDPLPDVQAQWTIDFDVLLDGWVIGTDHGLLWMDDQSLNVLGRHTSFAIPGHRLQTGLVVKPAFIPPLERPFFLLVETGTPDIMAVQFGVSAPNGSERFALEKAVESCWESSDRDKEGQLPPRTAFSNAHSKGILKGSFKRMLVAPAIAVVFICCVGIGALEDFHIGPTWVLMLVAVFFFQIFHWTLPRLLLIQNALKGRVRYYSRIGN